jgi:glycerol-3-phosphate dehydrogenase (NAD(P)+)
MKLAVINAGSFGTAVSWLFGKKNYETMIWARDETVINGINNDHHNPRYLSETELPDCVSASNDIEKVLAQAETVVFASPSGALREMAQKCAPFIDAETPIMVVTKGVEPHTSLTMIEILEEVLGNRTRLAAFSGPTHAEELVNSYPAAGVIGAFEDNTAAYFQFLLATPVFRIYNTSDVIGVELCGAAKNIMAISVGISYGLGFGDNTAALIMTRGLAEISRLVCACGGEPLTCMGLAGMGDLVVTCMSHHSRNRRFGEQLAQGGTLEEFYEKNHMVVEGVAACQSICELASRHDVEMPLSNVLRRIIVDHEDPHDLAAEILARPKTYEFYGLREGEI